MQPPTLQLKHNTRVISVHKKGLLKQKSSAGEMYSYN